KPEVRFMRNACRFWLAAFLGILLAAGSMSARAENGELEKAMALLGARNFNQTVSAINHVVASGAPHAYAIIEALADRRLFVANGGNGVFYRDPQGVIRNALTGDAV